MPDVDSYAPGTPSWVDLGSPDADGCVGFYRALFGWDVIDLPPEAGGYRMFSLRGRPVAGVMQSDERSAWTNYISSDDADAACARAAAAGGTVLMAPMDVQQAGRMALVADTQGAVFGIWQPREHAGSGVVNEPGAVVWNELNVRDTAPAIPFYAAVFGWAAETAPMGDRQYTTWSLDGRPIGGMIQMDERWPAQAPAHWMVYFAVPDADAACELVTANGGAVHVPPVDIPVGRFALVGDPSGAPFSVIAMTPDAATDGASG